ncbi:hypothetical protein RRG08_038443 [Elysia crispata]|uniref:Uncharacterized protein n=1 Tax=Elysia crispata TaxID=231223 RepID=A0AAE1E2F8_9GAST|nr:hypothetical protein RRG08_038443 [Elysia crispata]
MTHGDRPSPPACGMWRTSARTAYKEIGLKPASEEILCGWICVRWKWRRKAWRAWRSLLLTRLSLFKIGCPVFDQRSWPSEEDVVQIILSDVCFSGRVTA